MAGNDIHTSHHLHLLPTTTITTAIHRQKVARIDPAHIARQRSRRANPFLKKALDARSIDRDANQTNAEDIAIGEATGIAFWQSVAVSVGQYTQTLVKEQDYDPDTLLCHEASRANRSSRRPGLSHERRTRLQSLAVPC